MLEEQLREVANAYDMHWFGPMPRDLMVNREYGRWKRGIRESYTNTKPFQDWFAANYDPATEKQRIAKDIAEYTWEATHPGLPGGADLTFTYGATFLGDQSTTTILDDERIKLHYRRGKERHGATLTATEHTVELRFDTNDHDNPFMHLVPLPGPGAIPTSISRVLDRLTTN
jgi:hypothetical protein